MISALTFLFVLSQLIIFFHKSIILQNQYYSIKRYSIFYIQKKHIYFDIFLFTLFLTLSHIDSWFMLLFFFIGMKKHKRTKLIFSNRIKRHFIIFLLLIIMFFCYLFFININRLSFLLFVCLGSLYIYWLSFFISSLIEKIIQKKYIILAQDKINKYKPIIIGITGSYGKTSCKNFLLSLINKKQYILSSPLSYNTLNGLIKTINTELNPYHKYFIAEIGVDKKGGMDHFLKTFNFSIGAVTCIGLQHLKTFKTIVNIETEKKKLLKNCKDFSIINKDDPYINKSKYESHTITFSTRTNDSDICVFETEENYIKVQIFKKTYFSKTCLVGTHNLSNLACAIAIAKALSIQDDEILKNIPKIKNPDHRLNSYKVNNWIIIDDAYNSNFSGFENALNHLNTYQNRRKVIITPGIIETNKKTDDLQFHLANRINSVCDIVLLINKPYFKKYISNYLSFNCFESAYNYLKEKYFDNHLVILIENDLPEIFIR